ncbi:MAG: SDR family oxidoreductase [Aquisalinus sp.]|nr:SDR family oxidoreductase [Aquisalinus sp.]
MKNQHGSISRRQLMAGATTLAATAAVVAPSAAATDTPDLSGTAILITGCSSGFGRLGAEYYARLGATVIATMRNLPRAEAEELRQLAARESLPIHIVEIDVLSDEQVSAGVAETLRLTDGRIDVLVNNAGIGITGPVEVQDMEATKLAFDTNVFGCHRMVRAVLPTMRAAGRGQVFSISSQLGRLIVPGAGHYSATKFALEAMSEQMAYELVPRGIDVTIIQPGGYPTEIWVNRNRYTSDLKNRSAEERLSGYPELVPSMGTEDGTGRNTDPMDVPRAIAEIISMPQGKRPLRRAVHPTFRPQEEINHVSAESQLSFLGETPYGPWLRDVLE